MKFTHFPTFFLTVAVSLVAIPTILLADPIKTPSPKPDKTSPFNSSINNNSTKVPNETLVNIQKANENENRIKFATLCVITIGAASGLLQFHINQQWNRRKNTHDFLIGYILGPVTKIREELGESVNPYDPNQDYSTQSLSDDKKKEQDTNIRNLLNYFEHMAAAIRLNIINENIAFECAQALLTDYYRWCKPYIDQKRIDANAPNAWKDTENLAKSWREKRDKYEKAKLKANEKKENDPQAETKP